VGSCGPRGRSDQRAEGSGESKSARDIVSKPRCGSFSFASRAAERSVQAQTVFLDNGGDRLLGVQMDRNS
jgi:hypothetical protein